LRHHYEHTFSPTNLPKAEQTRKVYPLSANCHFSVLFERFQQHLYKEYFMAGYNPRFLREIHLPLPEFTTATSGQIAETTELREGIYADYINYTVVTNAKFRAPLYVALNVDQNKLKDTKRTDKWNLDWRIGGEFQLNNEYYRDNPWDRGHMARRANAAWGETQRDAQRASDQTQRRIDEEKQK
jgi:DNA/RNA endonuclease G (NUC1)